MKASLQTMVYKEDGEPRRIVGIEVGNPLIKDEWLQSRIGP